MGARLFLALDRNSINAYTSQACPHALDTGDTACLFQRAMLYAMAKYGIIMDDTGSTTAFGMQIGSGNQYTSIGGLDVWNSWASHKWERYDINQTYLGKFDNPIPNSTINLMAKLAPNFKVLKSCVSEGICDGKLVEQARLGRPS